MLLVREHMVVDVGGENVCVVLAVSWCVQVEIQLSVQEEPVEVIFCEGPGTNQTNYP